MEKSLYGIAIFHAIGDILNCTPIAKQLKLNEPDCTIVWITAKKYEFILENELFIIDLSPISLSSNCGSGEINPL